METQIFDILAMLHLIMLSLWGGVVATEAVIEVLPFRQRELHAATIRFHYWIDLLVELPLVLAVIATGAALFFLTDEVTPLHLVKVGLGAGLAAAGAKLGRGAVVARIACRACVLRGRSPVRCRRGHPRIPFCDRTAGITGALQGEVRRAGRFLVFSFERSTPLEVAASSEMMTNRSQKSPKSTTIGISAKNRPPI